jgi:diacylglycerol kinase
MKSFFKGFGYAGHGLWLCIRQERNFRIHLVIAAYILWFARAFALSRNEWAVLLLTIGAVISAEAMNTAVERTMDLLSPARHPIARAAKDIAAGAVLVCAAVSVAVGAALFWQPAVLSALGNGLLSNPGKLLLLGLTILLSLWFIIRGGSEE